MASKQTVRPVLAMPLPAVLAQAAQDENPAPKRQAVEVGAQAIYEFRPHPKKVPWNNLADDRRAPFRALMKELIAAINAAGFQIRKT